MTITAAAAVIAALLSTLLTALASQAHWDATTKRIVSGVFALVLGTAVAIASNQIAGVPDGWASAVARWLVVVGGVAAGAQAFFAQFKGILSAIEGATTITPALTDEDDAEDVAADAAPSADDSGTETAEG